MDVEDLVKSYFRLGFNNKEIICLLAHQHGVIISKRHCSGYVGNLSGLAFLTGHQLFWIGEK